MTVDVSNCSKKKKMLEEETMEFITVVQSICIILVYHACRNI